MSAPRISTRAAALLIDGARQHHTNERHHYCEPLLVQQAELAHAAALRRSLVHLYRLGGQRPNAAIVGAILAVGRARAARTCDSCGVGGDGIGHRYRELPS